MFKFIQDFESFLNECLKPPKDIFKFEDGEEYWASVEDSVRKVTIK